MKNKAKVILVLIVMVLSLLTICSCGKKNSIVGHWVATDLQSAKINEIYFYSDGTYSSSRSNYHGSYSIDGDRLRLEGFLVEDINATFEVKGAYMTLSFWTGDYEYEKID